MSELEKALKILNESANNYKKDLLDKNVLFIFYDHKETMIKALEVEFQKRNFKHLTGIKTNNDILSEDFFERCLDKRLSPHDIKIKDDGTTIKKLNVISSTLNKNLFSQKIIGNYNGYQLDLKTDKLVGNLYACVGFVKDKEGKFHIPNTLLQVDIRDRIEYSCQVICTFVKNKKDSKYNNLTYKAKKFDYTKLVLPKEYEYLYEYINT